MTLQVAQLIFTDSTQVSEQRLQMFLGGSRQNQMSHYLHVYSVVFHYWS